LALPLHTFVRFEPICGKEQQLREELKLLLGPTRAEPGCIRIHLYEALRDPVVFYIQSEWVNEAAFDAHPKLPHMTRFLDLVRGLVTHPVRGIRTKQIG
jgi:quinol monooxygenase YgiN